MNLPNKLTIARVIMIPLFLICLDLNIGWGKNIAKTGLQEILILTGESKKMSSVEYIGEACKIARKYNLVTNFGKFMDPLADKLLVCSALIALVDLERIAAWIVIIIIAREFIISGFRLVASDNGVVIAASYWGKFKTAFQMITIIMLVLNLNVPFMNIINTVLIYISLGLTVISLIDYIAKNYKVFLEGSGK